ncbi:MAG: hypothetical protein GY906_11180 [bacterium]|nr:hypothetical protein [bacterium]
MSLGVLFHNVGHGQSIHIATPKKQTVVIDLGASDGNSPLTWLNKKTSTIHFLILSHPHGDHLQEIDLLNSRNIKVGQLQRPKWLTRKQILDGNQGSFAKTVESYLTFSSDFTTTVPKEKRIGNPSVNGGASISTFYSKDHDDGNLNNHSAVVVIQYLGLKIVIPGDNETASWESLCQQRDFLEAVKGCHVLVASHHGRESGFYAPLMTKLKPVICVLSDGPVQETDARPKYTAIASGWPVTCGKGGPPEDCKCVTTRANGFVLLRVANDIEGQLPLSVVCEKRA